MNCTCKTTGYLRCPLILMEIEQLERDGAEWEAQPPHEKFAQGYVPESVVGEK